MKTLRIGILGLGQVGTGLYGMLRSKKKSYERDLGVRFEIKKIAVKNKRKKRKVQVPARLLTTNAQAGVYDEEAREAERQEKAVRKMHKERGTNNPVKGIAGGVKQATYDSTASFVEETKEETTELPVLGTIEGATQATGTLADNAIKGAFKVATLGYADVKEIKVEEPESNSGETTRWSISLPGT